MSQRNIAVGMVKYSERKGDGIQLMKCLNGILKMVQLLIK